MKSGSIVTYITKLRTERPALVSSIGAKGRIPGMAPMLHLIYICPKGCGKDEYGERYRRARNVKHIFGVSSKQHCWTRFKGNPRSLSRRTGGEKMRPGDVVIFIDPTRIKHYALITAIHGEGHIPTGDEDKRNVKPALNVVYVDKDPAKTDPYGHQIARATSIVHIDDNTARANCWREM